MMEKSKPITISLPKDYKTIAKTQESITSPIPNQPPTIEQFFTLRNDRNHVLYLFYWQGLARRDYGPMAEKQMFDAMFNNQSIKIIQTRIFMGQQQEVLCAHLKLSENESMMIYSSDIGLNEFKDILKAIEIYH